MRTLIKKYSSGFVICGVVKSEEAKHIFLDRSLNVLEINNGKCQLYIGGSVIDLEPVSNEKISALSEFDVLTIHDSGLFESVYISGDDAVLFVTSNCNSNCIICPSSYTSRKNGSVDRLSLLLEQIDYFQSDISHITITGGEPLMLGNGLFTLLAKCKHKFEFTKFLLLTNGRGFSNRKFALSFANSAPNNIAVAIPIHAANAQDHDTITQVEGSFKQTIIGTKNLIQLGFIIEIRIVVNRLNFKQMLDIAGFLLDEFVGGFKVYFIGLEMTGNAAIIANDIWISYNESFSAIKPAVDFLVLNGIDVELYNFPLCSVNRGYYSICARSISPEKVFKEGSECESCSLTNACGGVFRGSYRFAIKDIRRVISC